MSTEISGSVFLSHVFLGVAATSAPACSASLHFPFLYRWAKPETFTADNIRLLLADACRSFALAAAYAGAHAQQHQSYLKDNGMRLGQLFERMVAWARDASEEDLVQRPGRQTGAPHAPTTPIQSVRGHTSVVGAVRFLSV